MQTWLYPLAVLAGLMISVQSGLNGTLGKVLERPFMVGIVSMAGSGLLCLLGAILFRQLGFGGKAGEVPWWAWCGGVTGAVILVTQPVVAPKIGAGPYVGLSVTAAVAASVVIDHFGLIGFQQHSASIGRIIGAALMVAGVSLVALF